MAERRLKFWGWGYEGEGAGDGERAALRRFYGATFGLDAFPDDVPRVEDYALPKPRIKPPKSLAPICASDPHTRLAHALGKSFPDAVRVFDRKIPHPPDIVAFPRSEKEVAAVMDWAASAKAALVPFGGGSSVVGGVEPKVGAGYKGAITLSTTRLDKVLEIDRTSRAARIQGGIRTPAMEEALGRAGLTLRHFPQSFQMATLGGMIATRSGGHFATLYTHIDDFVEAVRMVTPAGAIESRRLPGSGAGPSPDRLTIGSEGSLGVITEAWMRLQDKPRFRAGAAVSFADFLQGAEAVRALAQSGLNPANCRLVDAEECRVNGVNDGSAHLLVLGFESAHVDVAPAMARAVEIARDHGGRVDAGGNAEGAVGAWRTAFIRMPYFREVITPWAVISDTFETAITWERFPALHRAIMEATLRAIEAATGHKGLVTCRFTHVYPDGPAPYYSFHARGERKSLLKQWLAIKTAASDAVIANGGTITHHHAVGRDHMKWYERQRPKLFGAALEAAKSVLDPAGVMNPGVIVR
jgi:alkyldihydroxyacetonephosphate synthase